MQIKLRFYYYKCQEECDLEEDYKEILANKLGAVVKSVDFDNYPVSCLINYFFLFVFQTIKYVSIFDLYMYCSNLISLQSSI